MGASWHSLRGRGAAGGRAVARDVSLLAAVEALGRVDAVTREVTDAAARVTRLGAAKAAGTALLEAALVCTNCKLNPRES